MWEVRKIATYQIVDKQTGTAIASVSDESVAQSICSNHNTEISNLKWRKDGKKDD